MVPGQQPFGSDRLVEAYNRMLERIHDALKQTGEETLPVVNKQLRDVQRETQLSIVFISHDLAVVRTISHRVVVMYMGRVVEIADSATLFATPRHPYTTALIRSVPVPDPVAVVCRAPLRGEVPSLVNPPSGCVFHPRCPQADAACSRRAPALREVGGARVACHHPN